MDLKEIQKDVDMMNKSLDDSEIEELDTELESESTNEPDAGEESEDEDTQPDDSTPDSDLEPDEQKTESTPTPEPQPQPDEKDKTIEELRRKLAEKEEQKIESKPEPTPTPTPPLTLEDLDFLGDADLDEIISDPSKFNKLLNSVYKKGIERANSDILRGNEAVIRSMPDIVKNNIALISELKKVNDDFYKENEDLRAFPKVVGAVFEELIAENPDKTYKELLPQTAEEVRKRLELHKVAARKGKDDPPSLPRKKGGSRLSQTQPDTDPLLNELNEMDESLDK